MAPPAQTSRRRSAGVAALAVALLAVLVLAGLGAAASLRAGARAERVRGLVPFTATLATLVDELQRERGLSAAQPVPGPALEAARGAVDRAAAAYRDAAVRVEVSDRDRQLHQRLDAGLAQLADLAALRAQVDAAAAAGTADPAAAGTVFRRYTEVVGGLLGVGSDIGLQEAGQDAGLLRAVSAASAFSRAKELADRERAAAAQAAEGPDGVDPAGRIRLAALGGRQDALLDQFATMASPEQLARYRRAFPKAEVDRSASLRRAALEDGSGPGPRPDLAGWSGSATARSERMREVERGLTADVARQAALADQAADRRTLAYAAAFLLAASALAVLLVLTRGRSRRAQAHDPAPPTQGSAHDPAMAKGGDPGAHPLPAAQPGGPGLADLARRSQELVDQQLELLDRVGRDQADPRLPGRLLQVDRLAVRARRNAHNLIVLAGGEPTRRWDGPAPLDEVAAVAVQDNPDAPRVSLEVADDLLVAGSAAGDLANLLAELVDNATAFSAPETRVRVGGQKVGSGYVLEVEDQGLGMTDGELEAVNRRLAGDPATGPDPGQGLGAWVAGRLAERHGVRVQLRRSPYGGVTALVFLPERLVVASAKPGPAAREGEGPATPPPGGDQADQARPTRPRTPPWWPARRRAATCPRSPGTASRCPSGRRMPASPPTWFSARPPPASPATPAPAPPARPSRSGAC